MKYILKTEVNGSGNKVFSKQRNGKVFVYLAKDENGNIGQVDKNWILRNQGNIVNLGVSGDNIYPTEIKKETTKAAVHTAPQVVEEDEEEIDYETVLDFAEDFYKGLEQKMGSLRVDSSDDVYMVGGYVCGREFECPINFSNINPYNIEKVMDALYDAVENIDPFEETRYAIEGGAISGDDIEAIYDTVESFKKEVEDFNKSINSLSHWYQDYRNEGFTDEQLDYCANEIDFEEWYDKTIN